MSKGNHRTRSIILAALMMIILASCSEKSSTGPPDDSFTGITKTDETGKILALDPRDWVLQGVVIGNRLFADRDRLDFRIDEIGASSTSILRLLNYSEDPLTLTVSVDPDGPLDLIPATGSLAQNEDLEIEVTYTQEDELAYEGDLIVRSDPPETMIIPLTGEYDDGGIEEVPAADTVHAYGPAYPNPTATSTTIAYTIPEAGSVDLLIYNSNRHVVRSLVSQQQEAGTHTVVWDGKNADDEDVVAGVYAAKITAEDWVAWGDIEILR